MFICPTCGKSFETEDRVVKHYLICWKEKHPFHKSKDAPRGEDVVSRKINDDMKKFFSEVDNSE